MVHYGRPNACSPTTGGSSPATTAGRPGGVWWMTLPGDPAPRGRSASGPRWCTSSPAPGTRSLCWPPYRDRLIPGSGQNLLKVATDAAHRASSRRSTHTRPRHSSPATHRRRGPELQQQDHRTGGCAPTGTSRARRSPRFLAQQAHLDQHAGDTAVDCRQWSTPVHQRNAKPGGFSHQADLRTRDRYPPQPIHTISSKTRAGPFHQ